MSNLIDLGCRVADVHHRYHEIHGALFGAGSFGLVVNALRGRRRRAYREFSTTLQGLEAKLAALEAQIAEPAQAASRRGTERELQQVMLEYTQALSKAVMALGAIFVNLEQDESAYRDAGADGRSRFTGDKLDYDHMLLDLERLGTRLNKLFAKY
jgi:hypothetical protein